MRLFTLLVWLLTVVGCSNENLPAPSPANSPLPNPLTAGSGGAPSSAGAGGKGGVGGAPNGGRVGDGGTSSAGTGPLPSADSTLSTLVPSVGALLFDFTPSRTSYTLRVPNGTTQVSFTATTANPSATLQVNGAPSTNGQPSAPVALESPDKETSVRVAVASADGTASTTYTIAVSVQALAPAPTIFSVGDSTMADYDPTAYPSQRGWMQMLPLFLDSTLGVANFGINGASSKSFYLAASWYSVKAKLKAGDYVFIQFGHNDEKDGGVEGASGFGTAASSSYRAYLTKYVKEARALGAIPVLFTPVVRLGWSGSTITRVAAHDLTGNGVAVGDADYPAAMRRVASELDCPLVDLTVATKALVEQYGPADAKAILYVSADNTHLQAMGAVSFAQLAAQGLSSLGIVKDHLRVNLGLVASSNTLKFGSRFRGSSLDQSFSVYGLSLVPSTGVVKVTAPPGFLLSTGQGPAAPTLDLPYARSALPPVLVNVRFAPTAAQDYSAPLTLAASAEGSASIALDGAGLEPPAGAVEAEVRYALDAAVAGFKCVGSGAVACADESLSGLYVKDYKTLTLLLPTPVVLPAQRLSILAASPADTWPAEPESNAARYAEFSISPEAGRSLRIDTMSVTAGASATSVAFRVYGSAQPGFATPALLLDVPDSVVNALASFSVSPMVTVLAGSKYAVRIYPYSKSQVTASFSLRGVVVHGVTN